MMPTGMHFLVNQESQTPPEQLPLCSTEVIYGVVTEMDMAEHPLAQKGQMSTVWLGMRG